MDKMNKKIRRNELFAISTNGKTTFFILYIMDSNIINNLRVVDEKLYWMWSKWIYF
jgi:hypothetical protein